MESFLLLCNTALMVLVVALTLLDEARRPGAPRTSPFRISERMLARKESDRPLPVATKRRRWVRPR